MQTEAMAILARRETVIKDARQVFGGDAAAVVNDRDFDPVFTAGDA